MCAAVKSRVLKATVQTLELVATSVGAGKATVESTVPMASILMLLLMMTWLQVYIIN